MHPRFSVVIPTRNSSNTISRCVAGVLSQTFASLELIVVDAGSSDATVDAVRALADSRVRVLTANPRSGTRPNDSNRPNDGTSRNGRRPNGTSTDSAADRDALAVARAVGFRKSRGEWSIALDPSDEVSPTWLSRLGKLADRSGATFVSCGGEQRFSDMTEAPITPVVLPRNAGVSACLRSGSFAAPTAYFRDLSAEQLSDLVTAGFAVVGAVLGDGLKCVSTPEALLRWNERTPTETCSSRDEQELSWAMQALDVLSNSPIPDGQALARYAAIGGEAAARLGRRDDARKLFGVARSALPEVPRYWFRWATAYLPRPTQRSSRSESTATAETATAPTVMPTAESTATHLAETAERAS